MRLRETACDLHCPDNHVHGRTAGFRQCSFRSQMRRRGNRRKIPASSLTADLAEALKEAAAAGLSIDARIQDYEPWIDPTARQPFVTLRFYVSGPDGLPAEGAKVKVSNSPKATFTVPASGWLSLVQDVSKGVEDVSITATKGDLSGSKEMKVFTANTTVSCRLPGEPSQVNALSNFLDTVIPMAPPGKIGKAAGKLFNWLGAINTVKSSLPEDLETVTWGTEYTGTFKTLYGLDARVEEVKAGGDITREFDAVFSRDSALLDPLFKGDGTPIQQIGRYLMCHGGVA